VLAGFAPGLGTASPLSLATFFSGQTGFFFDFGVGATGGAIATATSLPPTITATATQGTGANQPTWTANAPDYAAFDGVSDNLLTNVNPATSGTLAAYFRATSGASFICAIGANGSGGTTRAHLGLNSSGQACGGLGTSGSTVVTGGASRSGQDIVVVQRWNGTTVELWCDGARLYSAAQAGLPTTADAIEIGALNLNGTPGNFLTAGRVYRAAYINKYVADSDIAALTQALRSGIVA
jgi:hypothetical protein